MLSCRTCDSGFTCVPRENAPVRPLVSNHLRNVHFSSRRRDRSRPAHHHAAATMGNKSWILRDLRKRAAAVQVEAQRNAYLAVARNTTLPAQTRHKAQLALNSYNDGEGRMVNIKNRCMWTGRGHGECCCGCVTLRGGGLRGRTPPKPLRTRRRWRGLGCARIAKADRQVSSTTLRSAASSSARTRLRAASPAC